MFHVVRNSAALLFRGASGAALKIGLRLTVLSLATLLAEACSLASDYEPAQVTGENQPGEPPPEGNSCPPGERCCSVDDDCAGGESCTDGVCQLLACGLDVAAISCEPCVGADCPPPDALAPSCSDLVQNGDETDVDCGASCPERCPTGSACISDDDCDAASCLDGACAAPSCDDTLLNQDESDVDCGGSCEARCAANQACTLDADCASTLICSSEGVCTSASCDDQELNGSESDLDCGGAVCPGCPDGGACNANADCASSLCTDGSCAVPTCEDETRNQDETGVDCGGVCAATCDDGDACAVASDCASRVCGTQGCDDGVARCCQAPSCTDEIVNGNESDEDCGGNCPDCDDGQSCRVGADCESGTCDDGECVSCNDDDQNGSETDEDCGGPNACARCAPGLECLVDADCASNACQDGRCCGGTLGDCTRCAERLSPNLSCVTGPPGAEPLCGQFLECLRVNTAACPTRSTPGCSGEGNVCNHNFFGGDGGIALTFVTQILAEAACTP